MSYGVGVRVSPSAPFLGKRENVLACGCGCGDGRGGEALVFAFDGHGGSADAHFIDEELKIDFSERGFFVCLEQPPSSRKVMSLF